MTATQSSASPQAPAPSRTANPVIVLVSGDNLETLADVFWRYAREYDLRPAASCREACEVTEAALAEGRQVAMFVTDSRLPDEDNVLAAFGQWRGLVPTARRVITAPFEVA